MEVLLEQILRIEDGVVTCDAEDDLVKLAVGNLRAALMPGECNGNMYGKIGPGEDVGRRVPVDGSFVDDEGYGVEKEADDCSGDGGLAQNARALFDCHSWR